MAQSLKDIKSKRISALKADGNTRTIAGTFAISGNEITGLPVGNKIEVNDRIELTYNTVATQLELGLVGVADVTTLEPNLGILRIDKTLSQFPDLASAQAAFTDGLILSFQSGILAGATCQVLLSDGIGGTVYDGDIGGLDTGYWLVAFNVATATGFPSLTSWTFPPPLDGTDYTTISPSITIFSGLNGPQTLTDLIVSSITSSTSVAILQTIPNVASFNDVAVTKHSNISGLLVAENFEAQSIKIQGENVSSQEYTAPYTQTIGDFKVLWKGKDDANNPISNDTPNLDEIVVADPFNIGVDINIIQLISHPTSKDIAIMLYQDISDSNIYIKCFKYTYDGGFVDTYTPFLLSGADSIEIKIGFSTMINRVDQQINTTSPLDPIMFVIGGKSSPGTSIYGAALRINTTTLDISDSGLFPWGDTGIATVTTYNQILKIADMKQIVDSSQDDRIITIAHDTCLSLISYNTNTNTFSIFWSLNDASFSDIGYDYHGNNGQEIVVVKQDSITRINGVPSVSYPVSINNFSRAYKADTGVMNGHITLYKVDVYGGVGAETLANIANDNLSVSQRSNVNYSSLPVNFQNGDDRLQNAVFEMGQDKILFYKSYGYYVLCDKTTGKLIYLGWLSGVETITKSNLFNTCVNDNTIIHWTGTEWKTIKFLTDGPYLAYKKKDVNTALLATNKSKISVDFALEEGKTYYWSYFDNQIALLPKISTVPGIASTKIGKAIGTNTFLTDFDQEQIPGAVNFPTNIVRQQTVVNNGLGEGFILYQNVSGQIEQSSDLSFISNKLGINLGGVPAEFSIQATGAIVGGIHRNETSTGTLDDVVVGDTNAIKFTGTAYTVVTGFAKDFATTAGTRYLFVTNSLSSSNILILKHQNSGSSAANRITTPNSLDFTIPKGKTVMLMGNSSDGWNIASQYSHANQVVYDTSITNSFDNVCKTWDEAMALVDYLSGRNKEIELIIMGSGTLSVGTNGNFYNFEKTRIKSGNGRIITLSFIDGSNIGFPLELDGVSIRNNTVGSIFAIFGLTNTKLILRRAQLIQSSACVTWPFTSVGVNDVTIEDYGTPVGNSLVKESGAYEIFDTSGNAITYNCFEQAQVPDDVFYRADASVLTINYFGVNAQRKYYTSQANYASPNIVHNRKNNTAAAPIAVTGSGTVAIDISLSESFNVTPSGNIILNMSNPTSGCTYVFIMKPGATPYTIAFTQTIKWKSGTAYVANTANATDIVTLYYDGTNYYGNFGEDYA